MKIGGERIDKGRNKTRVKRSRTSKHGAKRGKENPGNSKGSRKRMH